MIQKKPPEAETAIVDWIICGWNFLDQNINGTVIISVSPFFITCIVAWVAVKQLTLSRIANRDNRFAKAAEMLANDKSPASYSGALYMLRDLVEENPEEEYIRCVDVIANWLRVQRDKYLMRIAIEIFTAEIIKKLNDSARDNIIASHMGEYRLDQWPNFDNVKLRGASLKDKNFKTASLRDADLRKASLWKTKLEEADLKGAKLENACVTGAEMKHAKELNATQITKAKWRRKDGENTLPDLPSYLFENSRGQKNRKMQTWLNKVHPPYEFIG